MTIKQAKRFYECDEKKYEIKENNEFITWLKNLINSGYNCFISIDELQKLIDKIVYWYEMKYPERELKYYEGTMHIDFQDIKRISDVMNIRQLLFRLSHDQLCLMECVYRAKGCGQHPIYENGKEVGWKLQIFMCINRKKKDECNHSFGKLSYFLLRADHMTGEVSKDYGIEEYLDSEEDINLDKLLLTLNEKYADELDFAELKECIYNHNCDIGLRNRVLQLVALKLLYSRNTIPERGYERAKRFINEFNKKLNLTLSTEEIDKIFNGNYTHDGLDSNEKLTFTDSQKTDTESKRVKSKSIDIFRKY